MIVWFASLLSMILIAHSNESSRLLDFGNAHGHSRIRTRYASERNEDACDRARVCMDCVLNVHGHTTNARRESRVTQWTKLLCLGACLYGFTPICHGLWVHGTTFTHQAQWLFFCCPVGTFTCCKKSGLVAIHATNGYIGANLMSNERYCSDCNEEYCQKYFHCNAPRWLQDCICVIDCQKTWAQKYQSCCGCLINRVLVDRCKMYPENGAELTDDDEYEDDFARKQSLRRIGINETMH